VSVLNKFGAGFRLPEKDYGDVCDIYVPNHISGDPFFNVTDRIDVFVLAHSLGWFVKALLVRDVKVSWICSIYFEIIELAFAHLLPNFRYVS
jgi:phosphatidylserine synthase 2